MLIPWKRVVNPTHIRSGLWEDSSLLLGRMSWSVQTAVTEYHRARGLQRAGIFLDAGKSKINVPAA